MDAYDGFRVYFFVYFQMIDDIIELMSLQSILVITMRCYIIIRIYCLHAIISVSFS